MNSKAITLACLLSCVGAAYAQQSQPVAGRVVLGVEQTELAAVAVGYRASQLIGSSVYNEQSEKVGKIGDLIMKPDGTLSLAIINVGGFLGLGSRQVAIPIQQFKSVQPKIVLPGATKEALKELPPFEYKK